jgi:hypothetical protein
MPAAKQIEPDAINKSLETDIERNVYELKRADAIFRQSENRDDEMSDESLDAMRAEYLTAPDATFRNSWMSFRRFTLNWRLIVVVSTATLWNRPNQASDANHCDYL